MRHLNYRRDVDMYSVYLLQKRFVHASTQFNCYRRNLSMLLLSLSATEEFEHASTQFNSYRRDLSIHLPSLSVSEETGACIDPAALLSWVSIILPV